MADAPAARDSRVAFVDRLRAVATIAMIEVHVVNALLATDLRRGVLFRAVDALNGLVAPAFLFCAGFAFALSVRRAFGEGAWRDAAAKHVRRSATLLGLGYLLHASALVSGAWSTFLQADVLQTIALGLVASLGVAALARTRARARLGLLAAALAVFVAAPFVRAADFARAPAWLAPYFTDRVETQFPLFPWTAFVLAGAGLGTLHEGDASPWRRRLELAAVLTAAAAATAWAVAPWLPAHGAPPHDGSVGPAAMLGRLAAVLVLGLALHSPSKGGSRGGFVASLWRAARPLGTHSLLVYFAHIAIVYGRHPASLRSVVGPRLGWGECAVVWALVTSAMYLLVYAWDRVRPRPSA